MTQDTKPATAVVPTQADAAAKAQKQADAIKRAARQAAKTKIAPQEVELVKVRVLPNGDGKISMGIHIAGVGEAHYDRGETIENVLKTTADDLEARGFAEIIA